MPKDILMPALAAGMEEGHLVRWLKKEGDAIRRGDSLAEIETDKAVMELEAEADGRLADIVFGDGSPGVPVGMRIACILAEGEAAPPRAPAAAKPAAPAPRPAAAAPAPKPSAAPPPRVVRAPPPAGKAPRRVPDELVAARKIPASPLARRLAEARGLDLAGLVGSGPRGRIVRIDVERAQKAAPAGVPQPVAAPALAGTAGGPLHHAWIRQGEGRPLVMVHGFGAELNGWRPFLIGARLARPVLGIDLPGHGGSAAHGASTFEELVRALGETIDRVGLHDFDLVAHSLGGAVSTALADEGRHDLRSLFLLAPAGLGPEINGAFVSGFARARSAASLAPWLAELVADPAIITPAFVQASAAIRDDVLVAAQQRLVASLFPDGTQAFGIRAALERIAVPVSVVFGGADRVIPPGQARGLPGSVALHLFAGIGHMPQLEIRESVWRILERHLRAAG